MVKVELVHGRLHPSVARLIFRSDDAHEHRLAKPRIGFVNGALDGDYFEFASPAIFLGERREDDDTLYEDRAMVVLAPRVHLVTLVDLTEYYDLPRGAVRVRYNALHELDGQPTYLTSNWLDFDFD